MAREKRLELVITGDARKAQKALNDLDAAAGKSQKATGKALDGIKGKMLDLGVAAGAMFAFNEWNESQKVAKQTEAVLKSTGAQAWETADAVGDLANEISRKTGIDDEAIQSAQNWLLTFKKVRNEAGEGNDVFDRTTRTMIDLSVAMGGDAKQAANLLGKALNDPVKGISALTRVGVTFSASQKEQIKQLAEQNDLLGAQKIILDEVESQVKGSAEAQATAYDKAKVSAGNLAETVGGLLAPAVETAANAASGAADWFQELDSWQQQAIVGAAGAGYAWLRWGDQIGSVASLMRRGVGDGRAYVSMIAEATRDRAAGVSRTRAALDAMNDSMGSSIKQTGYVTSGLAAAAAGVAAFGGTMSFLDELSDFDGDLSQLSDDLRLFAKGSGDSDLALQELGVSTDELAKSFKTAFSNSSYLDRGIGLFSAGIVGDTPLEINEAQNRIDALDDALAMLVQQGHPAEAEEAFARIKTELEAQGVATEDVVGYLDDYAEALDRSKREALTAGGVADQVTGQLGALGDGADGAGDGLDDAAEKAKKAERWLGDLTPTVEDSGDAFKVAGERVRGYYDELYAPLTANLDAEEALDNLTASVIENGRSLDTSTDEGRANIRALTDYVTASAMAATQTDNSAASMASYRQRLIELLGDLRYTKDEVNNLFTILGLAPDDILLNFTTNAEDAKRKVKEYGDTLWGLQGQIHTQWVIDIAGTAAGFLGLGGGGGGGFLGLDITPRRTSAGPTPPRAAGGPVQGDHWYRVNERGQEFFRPDRSGSVIPVGGFGGRTSSAAAGGGVVVNVHVAGSVVAERDLVASITSAVSRKGRSDGTLGFRVPVTDVTGVPGFVS